MPPKKHKKGRKGYGAGDSAKQSVGKPDQKKDPQDFADDSSKTDINKRAEEKLDQKERSQEHPTGTAKTDSASGIKELPPSEPRSIAGASAEATSTGKKEAVKFGEKLQDRDAKVYKAAIQHQLACAHCGAMDFHGNINFGIETVQEMIDMYGPYPLFHKEVQGLKLILNRLKRIELFLQLYSDYMQWVFLVETLTPEAYSPVIKGLQKTTLIGTTYIDAVGHIADRLQEKEIARRYGLVYTTSSSSSESLTQKLSDVEKELGKDLGKGPDDTEKTPEEDPTKDSESNQEEGPEKKKT